ncbi:TonB family protein [Dankookia rubra]|uniref:TonB family protein n=1 Tax=Dankookia rubra TaxID=1442381 RepID=A0A4R5QK59_9PROT|nr:TonB family protein [Dankookia rubra]TDH63824.1 TonB family protein [Dankookia rubra]
MPQAIPHPMLLAGAPAAPNHAPGRTLAWAGSAGLHLAAGLVLLFGMPASSPAPMPVMLLEMPAPEPVAAVPEPAPVEPAMAESAPAPAEPPPPEPPVTEAPPEPQPPVAEAMPEPVPVPVPEPSPALAETALAELPMPPPLPRPPAPPHRPPPPRQVAASSQPAAPTAAPPAAAPVAPAPAAAPPASYVARLFAALERHKTYPQEARYRRAQGVAMLHFRMRRDGTVIGYRLDRSAGDAALDAAVLAMIERASPLPAAPAELTGESIELTVPVRFALR